jgi:hypothetical protein
LEILQYLFQKGTEGDATAKELFARAKKSVTVDAYLAAVREGGAVEEDSTEKTMMVGASTEALSVPEDSPTDSPPSATSPFLSSVGDISDSRKPQQSANTKSESSSSTDSSTAESERPRQKSQIPCRYDRKRVPCTNATCKYKHDITRRPDLIRTLNAEKEQLRSQLAALQLQCQVAQE